MNEIPVYPDYEVGWRAFRIMDEIKPILYSPSHELAWLPGQAVEAECIHCDDDDLPGDNCTCGLYFARTRDHLLDMVYAKYHENEIKVFGVCALWGKVIPATTGFRAQRAYPLQLVVPHVYWRLCELLETAYGVPCMLGNPFNKGGMA